MEREWQAILSRYGQPVTVYLPRQEEGAQTRAIVQPVLTVGEDQRVPSPLGLRREDRFLYLGPAQVPLEEGGWVVWRGERYTVQAAHPLGSGTEDHHWWAMLRPREKEAP